MGYAEKRGDYYRGRYKIALGRYGTVKDAAGGTVKFRTKRDAEKAANDEESKVRARQWKDPSAGQILFGVYANTWYGGLELASSTMQNYRRHLEEHLLPEFENCPLADITPGDIVTWEKKELAAGYMPGSVRVWRSTLHTLLEDAVPDLIGRNPATKRRGKGKRTGRAMSRGPEKVIVDARSALLLAERAALMSGRDDEFVFVITKYYTGMRWGELVGLETKYARLGSTRVEWQLYELDTRELERCPPKDDSYRDVDLPVWLSGLVSDHIARTGPVPCDCHGRTYVFRGPADAPHWHRNHFAARVFQPAATGRFPDRRRPVPLLDEPWPGVPLRGRYGKDQATMNWLPIAAGLTPHGLRHSHKTLMVEMRTHEVLSHERLGHEMSGIAARYSHVNDAMRKELSDELTARWLDALDARARMAPRSPVAALDQLLQARAQKRKSEDSKIVSQNSPRRQISPRRPRRRKQA